jgi:hypothetical protein
MTVLNKNHVSSFEKLPCMSADMLVLKSTTGMNDDNSRMWSFCFGAKDGVADAGECAKFSSDGSFHCYGRVTSVVIQKCSGLC